MLDCKLAIIVDRESRRRQYQLPILKWCSALTSIPRPDSSIEEKSLAEAAYEFLAILEAVGLSEKTVKSYKAALQDFISHVGGTIKVKDVGYAHVASWISHRMKHGFKHEARREGSSSEEARRRRQATLHYYTLFLRKFLVWCGKKPETIPVVKRPPRGSIDTLSEREIAMLMRVARDLLDVLLVALLYETGMRAKELLSLRVKDVNLDTGEVVVRYGKYGKQRTVFLGVLSRRALEVAITGKSLNDRVINLTYNALYKRLKRLAKRAGLEMLGVRPHVLRHTFATEALRRGMSIIALQKILGHADIKTTQVYMHLLKEDVRREYEKVFVHFTTGYEAERERHPSGDNESSSQQLYCYHCGARLLKGARYCHSCGERVVGEESVLEVAKASG
uniref:Tyrosine recombinase XerA n=1 Tax=Fervidicoccus fontis TaxID=683846 RepID=A0A7J3ZL08_9CREN